VTRRKRRPVLPEVDATTLSRDEVLLETGWSDERLDELVDRRRIYAFPAEPGGEIVHLRSNVLKVLDEVTGEAVQTDQKGTVPKYCYFIGGEEGPVKIGFSVKPASRLRHIQSSSPSELKILATTTGGPDQEKLYHQLFAAARLHGEWFQRTPEIMAEIERMNREPER
jgi:hypothetical protein